MNTIANFDNELLQLIGQIRDETAKQDDVEQLETLLQNDPGARKMYIQFMTIHGLLEQSAVVTPPKTANKSTRWLVSVTTLAASLLLAFSAWWFFGTPSHIAPPEADPNVITFRIEDPEIVPAGNFDPNLPQYLIPEADVIVFGKVESASKSEVKFVVADTLRGDVKELRIDGRHKGPHIGCIPRLEKWPVGEMRCLFLKQDEKTKVYRPHYSGAGVQRVPYLDRISLDMLREIVSVWDKEFGGKSFEEAKTHAVTLGRLEQAVYDVIYSGYKRVDLEANVAKLEKILDAGK